MTLLAALAAGMLATSVLLRCAGGILDSPHLARKNYRGAGLPTAAGLLLVAALLSVEGARTLAGVIGIGDADTAAPRLLVLATVTSFGFLGLLDDLLGDASERGLRGHLGAALHGRVTTGFVKLGGGVAIALVLAGAINGDDPGRVLIDAALISLAANIGNLLDRAPGRTLKWGLLCYLPIAATAGAAATGLALAALAGSVLVLLWGDLQERFMIGDTGANALGAALGVGTVLEAPGAARSLAAATLLALTLLSEVVSFTAIIDAVMPLRRFDQLGRTFPRKPS
ncbi:MAG: hypothetical protein ACOYXM_01935 [Actinomycetota bacterium]